jgi:hypothetical protein
MEGAAMHVIFPTYLPIMWCSAFSDCLVGVVLLFVKFNYRGINSWSEAIVVSTAFTFQHFVIEGTAFVLMQYGCGYQAVKNAAIWAFGWSVASFIVLLLVYRDGSSDLAFYSDFIWNLIQFVFYAILWFTPETKLFRRGAVIFYSRFWVVLRISYILQDLLFKFATSQIEILISNCIYASLVLPVFILFKPYVVYKALLYDSTWWQGLYQDPRNRLTPSSTPNSRSVNPSISGHAGVGNSNLANNTSIFTPVKNFFVRIFGGNTVDASSSTIVSFSSRTPSRSRSKQQQQHAYTTLALDDEEIGGAAVSSSSSSSLLPPDPDFDSSMNSRLSENDHVEQQELRTPLVGMEVGFTEAQALAKEVYNIHREGTIRLLNFAYLTIDSTNAKPVNNNNNDDDRDETNGPAAAVGSSAISQGVQPMTTTLSNNGRSGFLGAGSFSKVYAGWYKRHRVAVKMLFTQDLNPEVIRRYSNEARILSEISHNPHVVKIYGVAVLPPR